MSRAIRILFDLIATITLVVWWGGLTFYSIVVIHTARNVMGSHLEIGFITQKVSLSINALHAGSLLLGGIKLRLEPASSARKIGWWCWIILALILPALIIDHGRLDGYLNIDDLKIAQRTQFRSEHNIYLVLTTIQWLIGLIFLLAVCWRPTAKSNP